MTAADIITALSLPADSRVEVRIAKKLLVENGAPTSSDKRQINDGIEELRWVAALKPAALGIPAFRDETREYLEIAVLALTLRPEAKAARLTELIHRAIPYPVFLIQSGDAGPTLSLAHFRWSQGQSGQTVLDGPLLTVQVDQSPSNTADFLATLHISQQSRQNLYAFYQSWVEKLEAYAASRLTGRFVAVTDSITIQRRRSALIEHDRLTREITSLRARAHRETQLNRQVELNLQLKQLEALLSEVTQQL